MSSTKKKKYSWKSFDSDCRKVALWAKDRNIKNIYGIPRGGLVVAVRLSHFTNLPIILDHQNISKNTLVVDDISDSGKTLTRLLGEIKIKPAVATLFWHNDSLPPDFWCRKKLTWVIFPWETSNTSKYDNTSL